MRVVWFFIAAPVFAPLATTATVGETALKGLALLLKESYEDTEECFDTPWELQELFRLLSSVSGTLNAHRSPEVTGLMP